MDIVKKVAGTLWGTRMEKQGDAHAAAQRLADAGLLRQPDQPVLTINVRVPTADVRPPIGLVVDTARGVMNWEGLNYYARPDGDEQRPVGVLGVKCSRCATTGGFPSQDEILAPLALAQAGWQLLPAGEQLGLVCPDCVERRPVNDGRVLIVCERCTASHQFTLVPGPSGKAEINVAEIDAARWSQEFGGGLVCPECGDA